MKVKFIFITTIFLLVFKFHTSQGERVLKQQSRVKNHHVSKELDGFKTIFCDEKIYETKVSSRDCLKLPDLKALLNWSDLQEDQCALDCEKKSPAGCDRNLCLQTCDIDSRLRDMTSQSFQQTPEAEVLDALNEEAQKKYLDTRLKNFMSWFCDDFRKYKGKDIYKEAFPDKFPKYDSKFNDKRAKNMNDDHLCNSSKGIEDLTKKIDSEFNACMESCKAQLKQSSAQLTPDDNMNDLLTCGNTTCEKDVRVNKRQV